MSAIIPDLLPATTLVDIGANLSHQSFAADLDQVINAAIEAGLGHIMVTGTDLESSQQALQLARQYPNLLSSTAGFHPHVASSCDQQSFAQLTQIAQNSAVVAIGETGLDYNRNYSPQDVQREVFAQHLQLAAQVQKPVFLHQRDAHEDFFSVLKQYRARLVGGVVHCFTDNAKALDDYLDLDMYIGITGWICDERRGLELQKLVKKIPPDRLLIETDAPYLLPRTLSPKPSSRRNEPRYLPRVLATLADCTGREPAQLAQQTTQNAMTLFGLQLASKGLLATQSSVKN